MKRNTIWGLLLLGINLAAMEAQKKLPVFVKLRLQQVVGDFYDCKLKKNGVEKIVIGTKRIELHESTGELKYVNTEIRAITSDNKIIADNSQMLDLRAYKNQHTKKTFIACAVGCAQWWFNNQDFDAKAVDSLLYEQKD